MVGTEATKRPHLNLPCPEKRILSKITGREGTYDPKKF